MTPPEHAAPRRTARALFLALLLAGLAAAYRGALGETWARWFPAWPDKDAGLTHRIFGGDGYYSHGPLILLVSAAIAVAAVRRAEVPIRPRPRLGGAAMLAALVVHLAGYVTGSGFLSAASIVGVLAAFVVMLSGLGALRRLWFALGILLLAVPLPEAAIVRINSHLRPAAAWAGAGIAGMLGAATVRCGDKVFLESGEWVLIGDVCSGLRTILSLTAFGAIYAYVSRLPRRGRIVLFAASLPVALICNVIRVSGHVIVADRLGTQAAGAWFHGPSGLAAFALAVGALIGIERLMLRAWPQTRPSGGKAARRATQTGTHSPRLEPGNAKAH